jgi:hypothetical protein
MKLDPVDADMPAFDDTGEFENDFPQDDTFHWTMLRHGCAVVAGALHHQQTALQDAP